MEQINQLISTKNYSEALVLLQNELNKSFDLSDPSQGKQYNLLCELRDEVEPLFFSELCSTIGIQEKKKWAWKWKDSFEQPLIDGAVAKPISLKLPFGKVAVPLTLDEAFTQIRLKKSVSFFDEDFDSYICILDKAQIHEKLINELKNKSLIARAEDILNKENPAITLTNGKICHLVVGSTDYTTVVGGLNSAINSIYESNQQRVGVKFQSISDELNAELKNVYFQLIVIMLLLKITQFAEKPDQPSFILTYERDAEKLFIEKTLLRFKQKHSDTSVIKPTFSSRQERLQELVKNCLTRDPIYIERLKSLLNVIDEGDVPVLILGESGVGKSFLAKTIHDLSNRSKKAFEEQNCGGLDSDKLDMKLWGWKKGSFTGAVNDHEGKVQRAEKGTLFLDELDRCPLGLRNALLTFIETKRFEVLGGKEVLTADVRMIFGSNKDLKSMVKRCEFEYDLYFRISERIIDIPPLRERPDDIELIIASTLNRLNEKKTTIISIEKKEIEYLKKYNWPGNVRELVQYTKSLFFDAWAEGQSNITIDQIIAKPFRNLTARKEDDFDTLVEILQGYLSEWNGSKGPFLDEIIAPILSKIYMDDCLKSFDKTTKWESAMNILGISGSRYNSSTLAKSYQKYSEVKTRLLF
ncbi:MAG: sigma 54-interacting transcriptional regulator [Ignavibacteria bacterium]|nr:sigma 54-interacting transcriptional regulator [Ignavibacteria bacterium]